MTDDVGATDGEMMDDGIDERIDERIDDARLARAIRALREPVATDEARFDAAVLRRMQRERGATNLTRGATRAPRAWLAFALAAAILIAASVRMLDHHTRHHAGPAGAAATRLVQFELDGVQATSVAVAGSFNEWNPNATPLHRSANGRWVAAVRLRPGRHVYQFVVDRTRWIPDPRSPRDPGDDFGTPNSVITVLARGSGS